MAVSSPTSVERIVVLTAGVLVLLAPILWIGWSLAAASAAAEAVSVRAETLASLRERLPALGSEGRAAAGDARSIYLSGETTAIAGAALQRIVADTIREAGGVVEESELTQAGFDEADESNVRLRVSYEADIVGLQRILFNLETGVPLLFLQSLDVQSGDLLGGPVDSQQPTLRVVMVVDGYRGGER